MSIYQHFRPDEKVFIDACQQWKESVERTYTPKLTAFLTPREQQILLSIVGNNEDCQLAFFGGQALSERKRALLYPSYFQPEDDDFEVSLLEITYNSKFHSLRHQQVLGTLMSLGIKREKFGDVLLAEGKAQVIVAKDICDYVLTHITKIGQAGVTLKEAAIVEMIVMQDVWQDKVITSSSLRIDSLLSSITNLSRSKAQEYVHGGKIKVNHKVIEENAYECHEGDLISARGLGRFKVKEIEGKTKRDKWRILVGKQS